MAGIKKLKTYHMDKIQLNFNEYLRYLFAGAIGVLGYLYFNYDFNKLFNLDKSIFTESSILILISLVFGSLLYSLHRALLYPLVLRINLFIYYKTSGRSNFPIPKPKPRWYWCFRQDLLLNLDFNRWKQRKKEKSFSIFMNDWFSQIHFLYCSVWALTFVIVFTILKENETRLDDQSDYLITFGMLVVLLYAAFRTHYRSIVFDQEIDRMDDLHFPINQGNNEKIEKYEIKIMD